MRRNAARPFNEQQPSQYQWVSMDRLPWAFSRSATRRCGTPVFILTLAILLSDANRALAASPQDSVSFRQDVVPIFTRYGCNAGNCHGKVAGQNGFRLSLRGYAPEWDYEWLIKELNGRRIDYARPESSLILLKATAQVGHEGGKRFEKDSRAAQTAPCTIKIADPATTLEEKEPNNSFKSAQELPLGKTVLGAIQEQSDVDVYKFTAPKPNTKIIAQITADRKGSLLDASLTLYDAAGNVLATAKNVEFSARDVWNGDPGRCSDRQDADRGRHGCQRP
jgi:hypothetical protein